MDKLFADAGESFGEVVLRKRLEAAAALLDLTTFNRRFKRAYDRTPRD